MSIDNTGILDVKLCTERIPASVMHGILSKFGLYRCCSCGTWAYTLCSTCVRDIRYDVPTCSVCEKYSFLGKTHTHCQANGGLFDYSLSLYSYTKVVKRLMSVYKYQKAYQYQRVIEKLTEEYVKVDPFLTLSNLFSISTTNVVIVPVR